MDQACSPTALHVQSVGRARPMISADEPPAAKCFAELFYSVQRQTCTKGHLAVFWVVTGTTHDWITIPAFLKNKVKIPLQF